MKEKVLLFFLVYCVVKVYGQIGLTGCNTATQANCPNFLPNSYCNLGSLLCECLAGYTTAANTAECEYNCGDLTDPDNGAVSTPAGTHTGDAAQYTCVSTFKVVGTATRTCQQDTGWDGAEPTCEPEINGCAADPCQNGATCVDQIASYTCNCAAGYDGIYCENNINECAGNPCQNGGVCTDGINLYTCACVTGYDGGDCQNNIDKCTPNQCQNSGTCVDGINDYTCTCLPGYNGDNCEYNIDECTPDQCQNGATCVDGINAYTCTCVAGYEGNNCQTNINECIGNVCQNGATCVDGINQYTCTCVAGYDGNFCQNNINECASHACQNGATCVDGINTYTCVCVAGYDGTFCDNNIDECAADPCTNGGTCVDKINDYTCNCVAGYTDKTCATDIDDCATSPCQNVGSCQDAVNDYTCVCAAGYTDKNCQTNINECETHACNNGATCVDRVNAYECVCTAGWEGTFCSLNIDECETNQCQNGAICVDGLDSYTCDCVEGYNGIFCQNNINECVDHACDNGATCVDEINQYTCTCVAGYTGEFCATNIDECDDHACLNGATCVDRVNKYTCTCVAGYTDTFCQTNIDECASHSCQNSATCVDEINDYTCVCAAGYTDKYCQTDINECASSPCQNGGTCTDQVNGYVCACNNGFTGLTCRPGELGDDCSSKTVVCGNIANAECDGSICFCESGYEDPTGATGSCSRVDCGTLTPPTDGAVDHTSEGTDYESKAYFSCNAGYTLTGLSSVTCQADKSWNGATPTCVIKDCGSVAAILNGALQYTPNKLYKGLAEFSCNTGYTLVGDATRTCQDTGVWSGANPVCQINDCGTIVAPANGNVDLTDGTTYESVAVFQCNNGYDMAGAASLECLEDGSWDNAKPTCNIKDCGFLTNPANGAVDNSEGTTYLSNALFTCNIGYTLVGSSTRRCQASGTWSGTDPVCQINDCGVLTNPSNGNVDFSSGTSYGNTASYSCDAGFELNGVLQRTCQADSSWSSSAPTCDRLDCGNLKSPTSGSVDLSDGTLFEATAVFTCNPGYTLTGDSERYCTNTGDWDNSSPTCIIKDCGQLTDPENGQVLTVHGTTYNEEAEYSCNSGYQVNGVFKRTCEDDGRWSASDPTCEILDCGFVADIVNGGISYSLGTIYGSTVYYVCDNGYEVTGVASRVCLATGSWSDNQPVCTILDCDAAISVPHAVSKTPSGSQVGDVAIYECSSGYGLVGNPNVTCEASGFWGTVPECRLDCGIPPVVENGQVTYTAGTLVSATATYTCNDGYYISGISMIECQDTGSWTNEPFCFIILRSYNEECAVDAQCITDSAFCRDDGNGADRCLCSLTGQHYDSEIDKCLADCGGLVAPTNGEIQLPDVYSAGQIAVYSCDRGYSLTGPGTRTCLDTGRWNGTAPQCTTGCPNPEPPANGEVQTSNGLASGDTITYVCNTGFALVGAAERKCNSDSQWSGSEPSCNIQCPTLPNIKYGLVDLALGRWEGSKAVYVCENNYAVVGASTRTCQSSGLWDGVEPECVFAIFPDVLLVFGSLFVFLVLIDVFILAFCVYLRYFKKPPKEPKPEVPEKKTDFPDIFDEEEKTGVPPAAFLQASQEHKERKEREKLEKRLSKAAKVAPETRREILRMDEHPPPRRGPHVRVEKKPYIGFEKPSFLKKIQSRRNKDYKHDNDLTKEDIDTDRSKVFDDVPLTPIEKSNPPPNSIQQQAMRELREDTTHHLDDFLKDGGYGTANSDDSHPKIPDDDQLSLDDLTPPEQLQKQYTSPTPKEPKKTGDQFEKKFYGRIPLPPVSDTQVSYDKETPEKPYTDKERRHLKNTIESYR